MLLKNFEMKLLKSSYLPLTISALSLALLLACGKKSQSGDSQLLDENSSVVDAGLTGEEETQGVVNANPGSTQTTYYVSASGNDRHTGLSAEQAFKTLQKAADLTNPGDTVLIMNGTYTNSCYGCEILNIQRSGTPDAWITYKAHPGHSPKLQLNDGWNAIKVLGASYFVIEGLEIEGNALSVTRDYALSQSQNAKNPRTSGNCIYVKEKKTDASTVFPHHFVIRKNKVHHCGGSGIAAERSDYVTIEDNEVYSNAWWSVHGCSGISLFHPYDTDENRGYKNFIRRNRTYDNRMFIKWITANDITDGNGIIVDDTKNTQINKPAYRGRTRVENNITYLNGGSGIHAYKSAHVDIVNNTSYMNGVSEELQGEIYSNGSDDVKILNNIMYARAGEEVNHNWGSTNYVNDYNIYYNTTRIPVKGSNDIEADPKFENPANGDFRLKAGSRAINSGTATLFAATDILGVTRVGTSVDRGAYEVQGSGSGQGQSPGQDQGSGGLTVVTTLEAEQLASQQGARHPNGQAWVLSRNGSVASNVTFPASVTYTFQVVAGGTLAGGVAPVLELKVGDTKIGTINLTGADFRTYTVTAPVTAGARRVSVDFVNDFYDQATSQDRNAFIDKIVIKR